MIFQEVRTKEYIEKFTISKFQMAKDISIICNAELKDKLLDSVQDEHFDIVDIFSSDETDEYIVSKVTNVLVVEPSKTESGDYKLIDAQYIIVTEADKVTPSALGNFLETRQMWLFAQRVNGSLFKDLQFLEFGGKV